MTESLRVGNLNFALRRSTRRKTIGITVDRQGELILRVPTHYSTSLAERAAAEKLLWVYTKLAEKKLLFQPSRPKKFIDGEGFYYLGKSYRLLLVDEPVVGNSNAPLRLEGGWFLLRRSESQHAEQHFVNWYLRHARAWISNRIELYANRVGVQPQGIDVRRLGFRWGSCTPSGRVNFHWRTILLPPEIIDYIIVHELVHLREPTHSALYWRRVERVIPDYLIRKKWLSENGGKL